jgi:hypothetical protein
MRTTATPLMAALAYRFPPRFKRIRFVLPLEAGIGHTPHSLAKSALGFMRSGFSPTRTNGVKEVVHCISFDAAFWVRPAMGPPPALWGSASPTPWPPCSVSGRSGLSQTEPTGCQLRIRCLKLLHGQASGVGAGDRHRARYTSRTMYRLMQRTISRRVLPSDMRRAA